MSGPPARLPRPLRRRSVQMALATGAFLAAMGAGVAYATFSATATNSVNLSAAGDLKGPSSTAQTVTPTGGAITAGFISQGVTFYVYANVVDAGSPPSGIASVSADVSTVSPGQTAVPFTPGSFSVAGVSYNYRTVSVTARNPLAPGTYVYAITSTDNDGNTRTQPGFVMTVENVLPTVSGTIAPVSGSASSGFIKQGAAYYVYANAVDSGSGVFTVSANVSSITPGMTGVPLVPGSYSAGGVSYAYRSASLTANNPLAEGTYTYPLTAVDNAGNTATAPFSVGVDNTAPSAIGAIAPTTGAVTCGFTKQATSNFVYANVTDGGTPSSGVSTVTANISTISTGQTSVALVAGSYTCGGASYNYRSAALADNTTITAGSYAWTVTSTDNASNTQTQSFTVVLDNTVPTITRQILGPTGGATTCGYIAQGTTYYYYAQVSDATSGVNAVTVNAAPLSAGQTAVPLTAGAFTCGATAYNYRSAAVTADTPKAEGPYVLTLTLTDNSSNVKTATSTANVDNTLPSVTNTTIAPTGGAAVTGFIRQGGTYYVYANVADGGSPASGLSTVTANVSSITTGSTAVTLTSGAFTVGGVSYNRRSASTTASNPKAEGIYSYSITSTDNASNGQTQTGYTVTVDDALPTVGTTAIALTSGANVAGYIKQGAAYFVYANVTDTGSFPSGLFTVTTNVSTLTTGQTVAPLTAGSYSFGGTTYNYRSASLVANAVLAEGAKTYTVTGTDNAGNVKASAAQPVTVDNTAPSVTATTIAPIANAAAGGYVAQGGTFYVYAIVADAASGVWTVTADVSSVSAGRTAAPLTAGSYPFAGTTYTFRSAPITADTPKAQGSYAYSITSTDNISNAQTQTGYTVTVDDTPPTITAIALAPTSGASMGGYVTQGGTFYAYANVTDTGGSVGVVTADVNQLSAGQTAVLLVAGSYSAAGVSYNYRSASVTVDASKAQGSYGFSVTAFDNAANSANRAGTVVVDDTPPAVATMAIALTGGSFPGSIKQGATYYVYANVTDGGAPASGLSSVTANVSSVSAGQSAVPLVAGSYALGAAVYNYRSAAVTADASKAEGSYAVSVTGTDNASNAGTLSTNVVVDNTAPTVSAAVIARVTGEAPGSLKQGDSFYVYANVADGGTIPSGIATVTADVSTVASGQTLVPLMAGSYSVGGVNYGYRSAAVSANATIADGAYAYTITSTDQIANVRTQSFSVTIDDTAPTVSTSVIAKSAGGTPGFIRQGGTYFVYANVSDAGSGVAAVSANVSTISSGQTAVALSAGSFTIGGVTYGYRSASLTADGALGTGSKAYSIAASDQLGNSGTQGGFSVTVDNTGPNGSDIQAVNVSTIVGRAQIGDTITYTFSETMDPNSILSGWTGGSTSVVLHLNNNAGGTGNDTVTIFNAANTTLLNLGTVDLGRTDYTTSNITFGATGTASTMVLSGSTITVTLGTQSAAATTAAATGTMTWTPSSSATDPAGNTCSVSPVLESGAADKEF